MILSSIMGSYYHTKFNKEIADNRVEITHLTDNLIINGVKINNITRLLTVVSDDILRKIIDYVTSEIGTPPVKFAFIVLGSEGRKEQTLKTDQDNAIIIEDLPGKKLKIALEFFQEFSEKISYWLNEAGYAYCEGDIMAKNPKWCQPLKTWCEYFSHWIHAAEPEDLLRSSIFFDFRYIFGEQELADDLRRFLFSSLKGWSGFFRHLCENALYFKPPIGIFGKFILDSGEEHQGTFNVKAAMQPIVDFARIYALQNQIEETNTLERLKKIKEAGKISDKEFSELEEDYSYLMLLRFRHQIRAIIETETQPDNYIHPKRLSPAEQDKLKKILHNIAKYQKKLDVEFTGLT